MVDGACIRSINHFQDPQTKGFILESNSWNEFSNKINLLGNDRKNNKKKGDAFELLTSLYLASDPIFASKLSNLWHHSNIPFQIFEALDLKKPEIGVDLVAESNDGNLWAIQCKYHEDIHKNVSYEEVSTFFGVTEREKTFKNLNHRIISSTALDVSKKISNVHKHKLGYLTYSEFSQLGNNEFGCYHALLKNQKINLNNIKPREHQEVALEKGIRHFSLETRGKLVHPCGAGKSLTGYWLFRYLNANNALIIVPSLQLVRQTLKTWARELLCEGIDIDWIAICSDDDVKNLDDPSMNTSEIGIEVNTDEQVISEFLKKNTSKKKIVITTYQSGNALISAAQKSMFEFEIGIFDEAHKTVGNRNKPFAKLLYDENIKISKRLFMTATERVFKGDSEEIISMDDELIYGKLIDQLSFKSALEQKTRILTDYKIVSASINQAQILELLENNYFVRAGSQSWSYEADASTFAALITLRKMIQKYKIKHAISFHSSIKRAKEFRDLNDQINNIDGNSIKINAFHVSGKDSTGTRSNIINRFSYEEPSLITNARCLTEGVDIPQVDAVLFADPKQSKVDIVQAAGRAMRVYPGKEIGYIIVPIVLDGSDESALEENAFKQIVNVVSAMGMSDDRIIAEFQEIAQGKKSRTKIFEFDFDMPIGSVNLKDLYSGIELKLWDRLSFAKSFIDGNTFANWMRDQTSLSEKSIKNYVGGVNKITNELLKMKPHYSSVDELLKSEDLVNMKNEWFAIPKNKALDTRGNGMYSAGFNKLIDYAKFTYFEQK